MKHAHCILDTKGYKHTLRLLLSPLHNGCTNAPQRYVIRVLPGLLVFVLPFSN